MLLRSRACGFQGELGGAEAFREWVSAEVLTFLNQKFRVSETTFVGHSFSALFGVHVLFRNSFDVRSLSAG